MMDAAEIPVKQYMPGAFTSAARPGMSASQRRSSSGVYDDEGLASTAAIRALYKQDPVAVAPHIVSSMRAGNGNGMGEQEHANVLAGGQNGIPPPLPRQGLNGKLHSHTSLLLQHQSRTELPQRRTYIPQQKTPHQSSRTIPDRFFQRHFVDNHRPRQSRVRSKNQLDLTYHLAKDHLEDHTAKTLHLGLRVI